MPLVEARSDSNAARKGAEHEVESEGDLRDGFIKVPYTKDRPAESNRDVASSENSLSSMGNDGTSAGAYKAQPRTFEAEEPKIPKSQPKE
jgi:hypothetical protein